jgi:hypothetical protein
MRVVTDTNNLSASPLGDGLLKAIHVLGRRDNTLSVDRELADSANGRQTIDRDAGRAVNVRDLLLAGNGVQAHLRVVVKEGIKTSTEDEDVLRVLDPETPCGAMVRGRVGERRVHGERRRGGRSGLVVWRLGLDEAEVVVLGVDERVLV